MYFAIEIMISVKNFLIYLTLKRETYTYSSRESQFAMKLSKDVRAVERLQIEKFEQNEANKDKNDESTHTYIVVVVRDSKSMH